MAHFRYIGDETRWVMVADNVKMVEPGDVIDVPDHLYAQTGKFGETPLFEPLHDPDRDEDTPTITPAKKGK